MTGDCGICRVMLDLTVIQARKASQANPACQWVTSLSNFVHVAFVEFFFSPNYCIHSL